MKKLVTLIFIMLMVLSLSACGDKETSLEDVDNKNLQQETDSGDETIKEPQLEATVKNKEWYYDGFYLEYVDNVCPCYGYIYCDGNSLWYTREDDEEPKFYEKFSVVRVDDKSYYLTNQINDRPAYTRTNDGEALEAYFINGVQSSHYGELLSRHEDDSIKYVKTNETEMVAGRKCTIYEIPNYQMLGESHTKRIWIDDEFGVVLKQCNTYAMSDNDGISFEVKSIQYGKVQPPEGLVVDQP